MILKARPEDFIVEEIPLFDPKDSGNYTYLLLEKKEYNTEDAIAKISEAIKIPRKSFGYAGSKDKNAITKQYVSARGKIRDIELKDIRFTVIGYGNNQISLGDLKGNKFEIVVRGIEKKPTKISEVINYFDEQRFGKNNLEIGLAIIKGNFKEASSIMDYPAVKNHLTENPNDYVGAIRKIPYRILKIFIHCVQSFLWNEAAYSHIKKFQHDEIKTKNARFAFPLEKVENICLPLVTFDTEFDEISKKIYEKILKENGIGLRDFIIRQIPDITPRGGARDLISTVHELDIGELEDDEISKKKKIRIKFWLNKGCYATIVIKRLFN